MVSCYEVSSEDLGYLSRIFYLIIIFYSVSGHHKSKESLLHRNALLQWYYSIYPLFGYCCVGTELFYVLLYLLHFYQHQNITNLCWYGCFPACIMKQLVNVVQLASASYAIASMDAEKANETKNI